MKGEVPRERGHERGTHRAFGEEIAYEVGYSERDDKRVHFVAGPEQACQDLIASQSEHAACEGGRARQARGSRQSNAKSR